MDLHFLGLHTHTTHEQSISYAGGDGELPYAVRQRALRCPHKAYAGSY